MKKLFGFCKRFLAIALVAIMALGSIEMTAFAIENEKESSFYVEDSYQNPLYCSSSSDDEYINVNGSYTAAVKYDALDEIKTTAISVRDNMIARKTDFTVNISTSRSDISNLVTEIFQLAISKELADSSAAGDYLAWQYGGYSFNGSAKVKNGVYQYTLNFKVPYYTTLAQEKKVTDAVANALGKMNLDDKDDYDRIKSIYDYVCKVCNYDNSKTNDYIKFTAYGAIINKSAVCQGYSTLLYRMLEEAGYDNKIVTSETHSWNIVKIDDFYFNLDPTWDDSYFDKGLPYHYFLKCNNHFKDHPREAKYKTKEFNAQYPMGEECYLDMLGISLQSDDNGNAINAATLPTKLNSVSAVANGFTVKWNKVAESTGYQVQYSTKSDFSGAATVYGGATNTTNYTVTGRANGTKYYVRVRAYVTFMDGNRLWGDWTDAKTVTTPSAPSKPTLNSVGALANGFKANWKKLSGVTGYQLQYSTKSNFSGAATVYAGDANAVTKSITGRAAGTKYYVRIRAYKKVTGGTLYGAWSASKAVTTPSKPKTASIKSVSALSKGFTVNWNKISGVTGYQVQYSTRSDFKNAATVYGGNANAVSKKITGRGAKTKYYVRVRAYKNVGGTYLYGNWSPSKAVTTKK